MRRRQVAVPGDPFLSAVDWAFRMKRLAPVVACIDPAPAVKKSFPMLPWYPASFMSSTRGWSGTARGIYRELLDCQWEMAGPPADASELRRLIGATPAEWKARPIVDGKFPVCPDGLRRNPTLEQHRHRAIDRASKAAASAREKWRQQRGHDSESGATDANGDIEGSSRKVGYIRLADSRPQPTDFPFKGCPHFRSRVARPTRDRRCAKRSSTGCSR